MDEYELTSIMDRVLARVIDYLLSTVTVVTVLVIIVLIAILTDAIDWGYIENALGIYLEEELELVAINFLDLAIWIGILGTYLIFLLLHGVLLHRYGQTIGNRLLNIAIVDAETLVLVPLPRLFVLRYLIWDLPVLIFFVINWIIRVIDLCFGLRESRRTLHDVTANTIVIKVAQVAR